MAVAAFPTPPMSRSISIVVSTIGMHESLARVLARYESQDPGNGAFEVVVAADAAEPDVGAVERAIGRRPYPVRLVRGRIPGLSANRNAGWRAAVSPIVLFTDNDTLPEPRLVTEHLAWHRNDPASEVAVLGHVRWARELRVTPFMRWLEDGVQFDYRNIDGIEAGWGRFYGANVSVKREFLERVGAFEEERLPYGYEDLDWAYRANRLGLRLVYNRRAVVEHLREMDLEFWRQRVRRLAKAERQFVRLHPDIRPYYFHLFRRAARERRAKGRGARLAPFVPRRVPLIGPWVWASATAVYRQTLAPEFLAAWEEAGAQADPGPVQPDLSEREAEGSTGSAPSGPK